VEYGEVTREFGGWWAEDQAREVFSGTDADAGNTDLPCSITSVLWEMVPGHGAGLGWLAGAGPLGPNAVVAAGNQIASGGGTRPVVVKVGDTCSQRGRSYRLQQANAASWTN
jgi:hypothetical protein